MFSVSFFSSGDSLKVSRPDDLTTHVRLPGTDTGMLSLLFSFFPGFNEESFLVNTPVKGWVDMAVNRLEPGGKE